MRDVVKFREIIEGFSQKDDTFEVRCYLGDLREIISILNRLSAWEERGDTAETPQPNAKDAALAALKAENERLKEERDDALATQIPPDSGAIRKLGERLADLLDEDDWNNAEPLLLAAQQSIATAEQENARIYKQLADQHNELDTLRKVVWHLERDSQRGAWVLEYYKCQENLYSLDIEAMQKEMGK